MSATLTEKVHAGMGAIPHETGVAFRVWAPHVDIVYVTGSFNDWSSDAHPMEREGDGYRAVQRVGFFPRPVGQPVKSLGSK